MTNKRRSDPERANDAVRGGEPRERLLAAAAQVLAEQGYDATTVKEVARVAGVSPGLFHYYFRSKDEALLDVIDRMKTEFGGFKERLTAADPATELTAAALTAARDRVRWQPGWYRLRYELFALGLRNPELRPALSTSLGHSRRGIAELVGDAATRAGSDVGDDASALAAVLLGCIDGLALQQLADPEFDLDHAYRLLETMIGALFRDAAHQPD